MGRGIRPVALAAEISEPLGTAAENSGHNGNCFNVCHGGGAAVEADARGERRLQARLALLALQRLNKSSFLAADVRPRPAMHVNVEIVAAAGRVLADHASLVRLRNRFLQPARFVRELSADVDVGGLGVHGGSNDEAALQQLHRVVPHDFAVLAGACAGCYKNTLREGGDGPGSLSSALITR